MMSNKFTNCTMIVIVVLGALLTGSPTQAAKPGGGGDSGTSPPGTIYYRWALTTYSMNTDGSNKTALPANVGGSPSRLLHGGQRWFIQRRPIAGEYMPDGNLRGEFFAVRADGNESYTVQLTSDATIQWVGRLDWAPGETASAGTMSFLGRRWVWDGSVWQVNPATVGVYTADVLFSADGNVTGLATGPQFKVSFGAFMEAPGSWYPDIHGPHFDWSPNREEIVYTTRTDNSTGELRIINVATGQSRLVTSGKNPMHACWSPNGNVIIFNNNEYTIETVKPDGTGRKELIKWGVSYGYYVPQWSPTGTHFMYLRYPWGNPSGWDIFRAASNGGTKVNLTSDILKWPDSPERTALSPIAWR